MLFHVTFAGNWMGVKICNIVKYFALNGLKNSGLVTVTLRARITNAITFIRSKLKIQKQ